MPGTGQDRAGLCQLYSLFIQAQGLVISGTLDTRSDILEDVCAFKLGIDRREAQIIQLLRLGHISWLP